MTSPTLIPNLTTLLSSCAILAGLGPFTPLRAAPLLLDMPAPAIVIGGRAEAASSMQLPIGPFAQGTLPMRDAVGAIDQRAYRLDGRNLSTLQLLTPLLPQLEAAGYRVLFQCETAACGGFDFRYGMEVLPEPQMHVDLGDFRYVVAEHPTALGVDMISVLVSRSADQGFVQVTSVEALPQSALSAPAKAATPQASPAFPAPALAAPDPAAPGSGVQGLAGQGLAGQGLTGPGLAAPALTDPDPAATTATADTVQTASPTPTDPPAPPGDFGAALLANGAVPLDDLVFASGSAALEDKDYASLSALAAWLDANPDRRVTLVGHTDASGSLAANVSLSRQRAQSVRATLVRKFNADGGRIDAQGAGYLAPRAGNDTPEGRTQNRRVEVMLTPTL